ncbi:MAG: hypothetical protein M1365_07635 [Actinobacteria bacterium]|nr:hypothetical protein [Actinomycetota bacterium]
MPIIQTVSKTIKPDKLGLTLMHEHCLVNLTICRKNDNNNLSEKKLFDKKISLKNRGEVIYNNFYFLDNLVSTDIKNPIKELKDFYNSGGTSIVDLTSDDIGRNAESLFYISKKSGINIIMGCGRYVRDSLNKDKIDDKPEKISNDIINEFDNGVGNLKIKPGIIGEIGISNIDDKQEINSLIGAAIAQRKIGCALNIHPPIWDKQGHKILDILVKNGADISKIIISHCDPTIEDFDYHNSLAKRGCYIEYDQFGMELMTYEGVFLPSDNERIASVKKQIDLGNQDKVLISGDMCFKICFKDWGGYGYTHILKHIIPRMKQTGITDEIIDKILIENPARVLAF